MSHIVLTLLMLFADMGNREDMRFAHSAEQGTDLSCGYSVLATLLSGYWGHPSSENFLIARYGGRGRVSVKQLLRTLEGEGFLAAAYRMEYSQLVAAMAVFPPVVVHMDRPEGHFSLLVAADEFGVVYSDPALGTLALSKKDFLGIWSGAAILVKPAEPGPAEPEARYHRGYDAKLLASAADSARGRMEGLEDSTRMDSIAWRRPATMTEPGGAE